MQRSGAPALRSRPSVHSANAMAYLLDTLNPKPKPDVRWADRPREAKDDPVQSCHESDYKPLNDASPRLAAPDASTAAGLQPELQTTRPKGSKGKAEKKRNRKSGLVAVKLALQDEDARASVLALAATVGADPVPESRVTYKVQCLLLPLSRPRAWRAHAGEGNWQRGGGGVIQVEGGDSERAADRGAGALFLSQRSLAQENFDKHLAHWIEQRLPPLPPAVKKKRSKKQRKAGVATGVVAGLHSATEWGEGSPFVTVRYTVPSEIEGQIPPDTVYPAWGMWVEQ